MCIYFFIYIYIYTLLYTIILCDVVPQILIPNAVMGKTDKINWKIVKNCQIGLPMKINNMTKSKSGKSDFGIANVFCV